jgi:hypothetical protein
MWLDHHSCCGELSQQLIGECQGMKRNPLFMHNYAKIGNLVVVIITLKTNPLDFPRVSMPNPVPYLNQTPIFAWLWI